MKIGNIDVDKQVFIVAEIGNNHEGDFSLAQELVGRAAEAGADAVKFQTFIPEYISGGDSARFQRLKKFQLSQENFRKLARQSAELGLIFFSTPFDPNSAEFLNQIQPVFKIASSDNDYFPLIRQIAGFGKPMIVSTGLANLELLDRVRDEVENIWSQINVNPGLALLHCVSDYPTPPEQANLRAISSLRNRYSRLVIGYSDHTLGIQAAISSVALGVQIIEKHFTLDKNHSDFRDHQLSVTPKEFKIMAESIREISLMLGSGEKVPQQNESLAIDVLRRSAAAARDLPAGTVLSRKDLIWIRPGTGITMGQEDCILGKSLKTSLSYAQLIQPTDLII